MSDLDRLSNDLDNSEIENRQLRSEKEELQIEVEDGRQTWESSFGTSVRRA